MIATKKSRFSLARRNNKYFLLGRSTALILRALNRGATFSYAELTARTGVPLRSLYVFCLRLELAKFIVREHRLTQSVKGRRVMVEVRRIGDPVEFVSLFHV